MAREDAINNSYQIAEEFAFKERQTIYHQPLPRKKQRVVAKAQKPGKTKIYTEEEIFIYQCQQAAKKLGWN